VIGVDEFDIQRVSTEGSFASTPVARMREAELCLLVWVRLRVLLAQ
jgi:hypothetical protein